MTDLPSLFAEHRVEQAPESDRHVRSGWMQFQCPWCGSDKWHLGVRLSDGRSNCYACGPKRLYEVIKELCRLSPKEAAKIAGAYQRENRLPEPSGIALNGVYRALKGIGPLLPAHRRYLAKRRLIASELASVWKLGGTGQFSPLPWRIFVPILLDGRPVSWQTRAIGQSSIPYINAKPEEEKIPAKSCLYGEDFAGDRIAVHEGVFDVFATGPGAVATLGIGFTEWQLLRLSRYPKRYICFDNEPAAQKRATELCDHLRLFPGRTFNVCIDAKDICDASDRERTRFRKAVFGKSSH